MLGKTLLTKKAHEKSLTSIEQGLMSHSSHHGGQEIWHSTDSGPGVAFIEGGG
jgi:hypothetical protein